MNNQCLETIVYHVFALPLRSCVKKNPTPRSCSIYHERRNLLTCAQLCLKYEEVGTCLLSTTAMHLNAFGSGFDYSLVGTDAKIFALRPRCVEDCEVSRVLAAYFVGPTHSTRLGLPLRTSKYILYSGKTDGFESHVVGEVLNKTSLARARMCITLSAAGITVWLQLRELRDIHEVT
jgi:hypothetical protein